MRGKPFCDRKGPLYTVNMYADTDSNKTALNRLLGRIFTEAMGFGACEMLRRVVGVDQNHETVNAIQDRQLRASAECDIARFVTESNCYRHR